MTWCLTFIFLLCAFTARCDYGGHDLFTSLSELRELWENEREVVAEMRVAIRLMDDIKESLQKYIVNHEALKLDEEPNVEFLGQPVNSYHLLRHVALGWEEVRTKTFESENKTRQIFDNLRARENTKLPDLYDVSGAAFGLSRLHSLYRVNTKRMIEEGVIESILPNGFRATSKPSVRKLEGYDLHMLCAESWSHGLYNTMTDLFPYLTNILAKEEEDQDAKLLELFQQPRPDRNETEKMAKMAIKLHDETLKRRGARSSSHRCHDAPMDPKLKKKKKYRRPFKLDSPVRKESEIVGGRKTQDGVVMEKSEIQKEMVCSGESFRGPKDEADLRCFYASSDSPWLRLAPLKLELMNFDPYIVVIRELMFPHECDNITSFLGPRLGFPPGRMAGNNRGRNDWTMKNAWPDEDDNIYLEKLTRRVEHISNLLAASKLEESDKFMCGNYGIGGHYGTHPDFKDYSEEAFHEPGSRVNRISTVMTVLEAPQAGGATAWPYLGVSIFPEKGSAAWWFNLKSDATPDFLTLHAACPVLLGQKWIGNKWIGYTPQIHKRPCQLNAGSRLRGPLPTK